MTRFLAYTSPARGHLYPITPTLLELARRRHDVHVRTLASEVPALTDTGLRAAAIDSRIEDIELDDWQSADPAEGIGRIFTAFATRSVDEIADVRRAIAEVQPDCLLIDITTPGAAAVAEASGLPWARWIPFLAHASFDPAPSSRIDFLPYSLLPSGLKVINDARAAVGLAALTSADDGCAEVELYLTAEPFELPGLSYPESFRLVGPGVWEPASVPLPWLEEVEGPLVLATASSESKRRWPLPHRDRGTGRLRPRAAVSTAAHDPGSLHLAQQREDRAMAAASAGHVPRRGCRLPRRHGYHPEGPGRGRPGMRGAVRARPVRGGEARRHLRLRNRGDARPADSDNLASAVRDAMTMRAGAAQVAEGFRKAGGSVAAADAVQGLVGATLA